ncbi:Nrap protein [Dunaliella salina]|uniref:Nrap protein n=1 Tax=Dunaliella salina TaxID=3046 RepID=A0ABQ7GVT4_DUNSA|nr:Nrap protein [Dunaliella salina]|eukprot:KAF5838727.1 Nrap protein [Dunaliella salina]
MHVQAYLNHRYHARRGLYLAAVAAHLHSNKAFRSRPMRWEACQQDPTRPVLVLGPPSAPQSSPPSTSIPAAPHQFELRLMACLPPSTFPLAKLAPDRNAVRAVQQARPPGGPQKSAAQQQQQQQRKEEEQEAMLLPTPAYNASVVADCCALLHAALLQCALQANPKLADGLLLLKVWARQHALSASQTADGLDGHMLAMLMVHLAERGKLSSSMTPLQMLRAALHALCDPVAGLPKSLAMTPQPPEQLFGAAHAAAPALLAPFSPASASHHGSVQASAAAADALAHAACDGLPPSSAAPSLATFRKQASSSGGGVFIDPSGHCNLAAHMGRASLAAVAAAAKATLALLDAPADADEAVAAAFLTPASHASSADYIWAVAVADASEGSNTSHGGQRPGQAAYKGEDDAGASGLCRQPSASRDAEATVETLARIALADRATWVHAVRQPLQAAPVEHLQQGVLRPKAPGAVLLKARLDPTQALRLVDVGPAADDAKAAAKFRAFWGEASELRRFQDGKISEAVVWPAAQGARHTIPDRVLEFAFARHRPANGPGTILGCSSVLDAALRAHDPYSSSMGPGMGVQLSEAEDTDNVAITSARLIDAALVKLGKQLRSLEGLVLKVVGVQPQSSAIRQTSPCPPKPHPLASAATASAGSNKKKGAKGDVNGGTPGGFEGGRLPRCLEPVDVLVQIENSGRWPSNPQAFKKMKAALGLQLAEALEKSYGLITQTSEDAVDVFVDGFAFRLTLYSGRDEALMARLASDMLSRPAPNAATLPGATGPGGLSAGAASDAASPAASPESMPLIRNWHHGLVQAVGGANPAYAPTVRLAHRWLGAHLLSNHFAEEAVELLVAAAFTGPSACPPPGSRVTGPIAGQGRKR